MINMISADLYKIFKSGTIKVLFGITLICSIVMAGMAYLIALGKLDAQAAQVGFLFSDANMISILGAVMASIFISGDYENKLIHEVIASGCSRGIVLLSKTIAFFCGTIIILLPYAIVTAIALSLDMDFGMQSVALGFLHILTVEGHTVLSLAAVGKLIIIMITLILIYISQLSICIPLALLIRKPVVVVAVYYFISIISAQLGVIKAGYPLLDKLLALTPLGGDYSLLVLSTSNGTIIKGILVSIIFTTFVIGITYGFFRKSEIK